MGARSSWGASAARSLHPGASTRSLERWKRQHLLPQEPAAAVLDLLGQPPQVFLGQAEGLAEILDDALDGVGGDGAGENGELRPEMAVDPRDQVVAERAGEVEVDVGEHGHVLRHEPLQGEVPAEGVDVADADQVSGEQGDRGAPAPAGGPLLEGCLGRGQPLLLHDPLGEQDDLAVEEQKAGKVVLAYQPHLLGEALFYAR